LFVAYEDFRAGSPGNSASCDLKGRAQFLTATVGVLESIGLFSIHKPSTRVCNQFEHIFVHVLLPRQQGIWLGNRAKHSLSHAAGSGYVASEWVHVYCGHHTALHMESDLFDCFQIALVLQVDVPGTMTDPTGNNRFRRMVIGEFLWLFNYSAAVCPQWSLPVLISLGTAPNLSVNNWVNISGSSSGNVSVHHAMSELQIDVTRQLTHQTSPGPITRFTFLDSSEKNCFEALHAVCPEANTNETGRCRLCAVKHAIPLGEADCSKNHNTLDVVNFWCSCIANQEGCGGPPD